MKTDFRVPAEGPTDAKIMIVGESPGRNEWEQRRPFVGWSGDLLNDALRAAGIARSKVFITNVIKDHLPPGGFNKAQQAKKRAFFFQNTTPTRIFSDGIAQVLTEIQEVKPNVVVPMGNYALYALMFHEGIMKWRGSILESVALPEQKVIPSLHPAFWINSRTQWHSLPILEWDFHRIAREAEFPEINRPEYNFIIDPTYDEMLEARAILAKRDWYACDTEWYGPNDLAFPGFAWSPTDAIIMPTDRMDGLRMTREILRLPVPVIMQNGAFDIVALERQGIEVPYYQHDTMVAWNACWASLRSKSLDFMTSVQTDQPYYKEELGYVNKRDPRGKIYCATDCVVTFEIWDKMSDEFEITGGRKGYDISMSIQPYMLSASKQGIRVDDQLRRELRQAHLEKANEIEDALGKMLNRSFNCRSAPQVTEIVHDWLIPTYGLEPAKRNSRQDNLMNIAATCTEPAAQGFLEAIIRVRQNRNVVSRYLHDGVVDIDGRTRTNWNVAGTRNGRLSSTIPWWPGLAFQTVPDNVRDIFIADPGHIFVGFDYEQAEARVVAVLTYNHELLDDMAAGLDIHTKLASQLPFGMTYDQLLAEVARLGKDGCRERYVSKRSRHAFNYVEGGETFALTLNKEWLDTRIGVTVAEGWSIRKEYLRLNPGLEPWWKEVRQTIIEDGYLINAFGRQRMHTGRLTDDSHRDFVAFYPQSTIADLCTQSCVKILEQFDYATIMTHMHDGAMFQIPEEHVNEFYPAMMELVQWPMIIKGEELLVPAEGKVGHSWGSMKGM